MDEEIYNRHYIKINENGIIIDAWSDGPCSHIDVSNAICINEKGSYQFRLYPDGKENPDLYTMDGIPLYKWDGSKVIKRTDAEIEAECASIPPEPPSPIEQLQADVAFLAVMTGVSL